MRTLQSFIYNKVVVYRKTRLSQKASQMNTVSVEEVIEIDREALESAVQKFRRGLVQLGERGRDVTTVFQWRETCITYSPFNQSARDCCYKRRIALPGLEYRYSTTNNQ